MLFVGRRCVLLAVEGRRSGVMLCDAMRRSSLG